MKTRMLLSILVLIFSYQVLGSIRDFNKMIDADIQTQQELNKKVLNQLNENQNLVNYDSQRQVLRKRKKTVVVKVQFENPGPSIVLR